MITVEQSNQSYDASADEVRCSWVQEGDCPVDSRVNVKLLSYNFDSSQRKSRLAPEKTDIKCVTINKLLNLQLKSALDIIIEPDDDGFIARMPDLPLYAFDDDPVEAIESLKFEIESLYNDLMEDDEFTEEWLSIKAFLSNKIKNV